MILVRIGTTPRLLLIDSIGLIFSKRQVQVKQAKHDQNSIRIRDKRLNKNRGAPNFELSSLRQYLKKYMESSTGECTR